MVYNAFYTAQSINILGAVASLDNKTKDIDVDYQNKLTKPTTSKIVKTKNMNLIYLIFILCCLIYSLISFSYIHLKTHFLEENIILKDTFCKIENENCNVNYCLFNTSSQSVEIKKHHIILWLNCYQIEKAIEYVPCKQERLFLIPYEPISFLHKCVFNAIIDSKNRENLAGFITIKLY